MNMHTWIRVGDISFVMAVVALVVALGWHLLDKSAEPMALIVKWIISVLLLASIPWLARWNLLLIILPVVVAGFIWVPSIGGWLTGLMTGGFDGAGTDLPPQPLYSMAEAKRRNSHPQEALQAVREQLEKFPDDFPGVMLMASIQAEDLNDLAGAQRTLEHWMQSPAATAQGVASALTTLADWQLQYAQDPEAARVALERIIQKFPGTAIAHRTAQRLAHLPTLEDLLANSTAAKLELRPGEKYIGLLKDYSGPAVPVVDSQMTAESYVRQLEKHPADTSTREKLAMLYAEEFQRLDLAVDQLEQLINFPNETPQHIARWLNLLADLHIRVGHDEAAAEAALRRILEKYSSPALVQPTLARLATLHSELNASHTPRVKVIGQYEKYVGLKR